MNSRLLWVRACGVSSCMAILLTACGGGGGKKNPPPPPPDTTAPDTTISAGPLVDFGAGLFVDSTRNVAFVSESTSGSIMAIDLASGDRVVIGR